MGGRASTRSRATLSAGRSQSIRGEAAPHIRVQMMLSAALALELHSVERPPLASCVRSPEVVIPA